MTKTFIFCNFCDHAFNKKIDSREQRHDHLLTMHSITKYEARKKLIDTIFVEVEN